MAASLPKCLSGYLPIGADISCLQPEPVNNENRKHFNKSFAILKVIGLKFDPAAKK